MNTYVIFRRNAWKDSKELEAAAALSAKVGTEEMADKVKWIRSYVVKHDDGTMGTVCIYQGTDEEAIREHAKRSQLAAHEILPVGDTVIVNPDPE